MPPFKKRIIRLLILWILIGLGIFGWIQYTLQQSRATADQIWSRAVTTPLPTQEPVSSTPEYLEEQQAMIDQQDSIVDDMEDWDQFSLLAQWDFNRLDPIHRAEWTLEVVWDNDDVFLQFPSDFKAANWPDLYVVLTLGDTYDEATSLNLWPLVSIEWEQVYKITRVEWEKYKDWWLLIWCRAFDIDFSVAEFKS